MILREALNSLKKSPLFTLIIILQLTITSFVCNLVIDKISSMRTSYDQLDRSSQKSYFWIVENLFDNELEHRFWESENSIERIRNYYKDMATSDEYKYLELSNHEITIKDEYTNEYTPASNFCVNLDCLNEFGVKTIEGRLFTQDEFNIDFSTTTLPVLLGYNLKDKFKVGDVFEGTYFPRKFKYQVIGILEKGSCIIRTNIEEEDVGTFYYEFLDNAYVTPMVNCYDNPKDRDERFFLKVIYMMKLNATIAAPPGYNAGEIKVKMDTLADKYDMYDFEIIQISNKKLDLLKLVSRDSIDTMIILSVILLIFSLLSVFAIMFVKINKNLGSYAVHLMTGARKKKVTMYILTEILIILLATHGLAFITTKILLSSRVNYSVLWISFSLIAFIAAGIRPVYKIAGNEIDTLLTGDLYE